MSEKILFPRVFIGPTKMTDAQVNDVVTNRIIPNGLVKALLLANEIKTDYEAHRIDVVAHNSADTTNIVTAATATDLATLLTLSNDIKAMYNAHCADAVAHNSADTTNVVTAADATDILSAVTLLNEIKADYEAHRIDVVAHNSADTTNIVTADDAYGWIQVNTADEGVDIILGKETQPTRNQQMGQTGLFIKEQKVTLKIPLSAGGFKSLIDYAKVDPDAAVGATAGNYKTNSGVEITGISCLIYDKGTDNDNETDIPDFTNDDNAKVFFNAAVKGEITESYNGEQNILTLEFDTLASTTNTGSGRAVIGCFGTFTTS